MLNIFNKKRKLTSHEKAITITHLRIRQNELRKHIKDNPDKDTWCTAHDIECLENAILYLDEH